MIISSIVVFLKYKPVYSLQLIHLIYIISTTFTSSSCLSSNKSSWNMADTFNNEVISPLFEFVIFAVCYIMVIKGNQWIVSFIEVSQYKFLSWRSINFLAEGVYTLAFFSYAAASRLSFHSWINSGWFISFDKGSTYVLKLLFMMSYFSFILFEYRNDAKFYLTTTS